MRLEAKSLSRITTAIAMIAAIIVAAGVPIGHYFIVELHDSGQLQADANTRSYLISQVVSSNPEIWKFRAHAIEGALSRQFQDEERAERRRVTDSEGTLLYEFDRGGDIARPVIKAKSPIRDSGQIVGSLEVEQSLRDVLHNTILIGIFSTLLGLLIFFAVRLYPMHALERAWQTATHDPLTGLPNRLLLADRMELTAAHMEHDVDTFAVHALDLDNFKDVNDALGHGAGDLLLKQVGQRLVESLRKEDSIARTGGDEFVVIQSHVASPEDAAVFANKLIHALNRPFDLAGHQALAGVSIGVALYEKAGQSMNELLQNADVALYRTKIAAKGTYSFFDREMNERLEARRRAEAELRQAMLTQQFRLVYQPQVDLVAGKITGVEALLRWEHPDRGTIMPSEFIGLAEETGLIVQIDDWVLRSACAHAARWSGLAIAVNVSPVHFRKGDLVTSVAEALEDSDLEPQRLEIEITEGILISDTSQALKILKALREMGVRIVMDDFGTGYSSLSYLGKFPFDKIKLDPTFVRDIGAKQSANAIAQAVIELSKALQITTTAEGVESDQQLEWLVEKGCTEAQGHLFAKPMSFKEVSDFIKLFKPKRKEQAILAGQSAADRPVKTGGSA